MQWSVPLSFPTQINVLSPPHAAGPVAVAVTTPSGTAVSLTGTFQPKVDYFTYGSCPHSVAVGDFNGDGTLDLAVVNFGNNMVSILRGNGNGTFQSKVDYATGTRPTYVAVGDFNGDGKLDLVVANQFSNTVSILLGNGDGTFRPKVDYVTGSYGSDAIFVAVGDLNGDGKLDLVVANQFSNTVSILLGNGDGTFQPHVNMPPGVSLLPLRSVTSTALARSTSPCPIIAAAR